MNGLSIIQQEDLPNLKNLYEREKPLHITVAIGHFIERFKKKPEWTKKVLFCSLNDNWRQTGTFAMVNTNDNHILFNTLEPPPYDLLRKTLEYINYDKPMVFICFRDIFRPVVLNVIRVSHLEITFDSGTKVFYVPIPDITIDPPNGFYFDSLNQSHVEKVNSMWLQRHSRSYEHLSNYIAMNPSTGLFHKDTGELVAWIITLETRVDGHMFVVDEYKRKGFGELTALKHSEKKIEGVGHVAHQNKASNNFFTQLGGQCVDNNSWIGIRPKEPSQKVPLWGHL